MSRRAGRTGPKVRGRSLGLIPKSASEVMREQQRLLRAGRRRRELRARMLRILGRALREQLDELVRERLPLLIGAVNEGYALAVSLKIGKPGEGEMDLEELAQAAERLVQQESEALAEENAERAARGEPPIRLVESLDEATPEERRALFRLARSDEG